MSFTMRSASCEALTTKQMDTKISPEHPECCQKLIEDTAPDTASAFCMPSDPESCGKVLMGAHALIKEVEDEEDAAEGNYFDWPDNQEASPGYQDLLERAILETGLQLDTKERKELPDQKFCKETADPFYLPQNQQELPGYEEWVEKSVAEADLKLAPPEPKKRKTSQIESVLNIQLPEEVSHMIKVAEEEEEVEEKKKMSSSGSSVQCPYCLLTIKETALPTHVRAIHLQCRICHEDHSWKNIRKQCQLYNRVMGLLFPHRAIPDLNTLKHI